VREAKDGSGMGLSTTPSVTGSALSRKLRVPAVPPVTFAFNDAAHNGAFTLDNVSAFNDAAHNGAFTFNDAALISVFAFDDAALNGAVEVGTGYCV